MAHDSTVDDTDEPHTDNRARTDGGSEAETVEESDESESDNKDQQESTDESESSDKDQQESTDESESSDKDQQESTEKSDEEQDEPATIEADDEAVAEQTGDVGVEPQQAKESDEPDAEADSEDESEASDESTPSLDGEGDTASIIEIRNQVIELSTDVIGRGLDGIIEVTRNDDNWRAVVEIIERRSVPDTQDILGQYEIELDESGEVIGYRRLEKYRRSDTGPAER